MKTRVAVTICLTMLLGACIVELPDAVKDIKRDIQELNLQVKTLSISPNGVSISASANSSAQVSEFGIEVREKVEYYGYYVSTTSNSTSNPTSNSNYRVISTIKSSSLTSLDTTLRVSLSENNSTLCVRAYAVVAGISVAYSQDKELELASYLPVISALDCLSGTSNRLVMSATVSKDNGVLVTERGFCWKEYSYYGGDPTILDNKIVVGSGTGTFSDTIKGLSENTRYCVRAYATNGVGTRYCSDYYYDYYTTGSTYDHLPVITSLSNTSKTHNTLAMSATVSDDNGLPVTERGFCWKKPSYYSDYPTINDSKIIAGSGIGDFSGTITGLSPSTGYYVFAYATNEAGTSYYDGYYTTTDGLPVISSQSNLSKTHNTLVMSATISNDNGLPVTERGFCWSTSSYPDINSNKIVVGSGTGTFSDTIKGLTPESYYYVRAYATNAMGTSYYDDYYNSYYYTGSISDYLPVISSQSNTSRTYNTLVMSATVSNDNGFPVTERGFCWSTSYNPDTSDSKITVGSGVGTFSDTITGLSSNTSYYVRAYAINAMGTSYYGSTYYTTNDGFPVITSLSNTSKTHSTLVMSATVSDDKGVPVTERGFCWSTSSNPTISNSKIVVGDGIGTFSDTITGLSQNTTYYVRAYATNAAGTSYYGSNSYTTGSTSSYLPVISSQSNTSRTYNTLVMSATVSNDNGFPVTERGFCWSTSSSPTISNSKIAVGSGIGTFSDTIKELSPSTNYYVRAYATNAAGTNYYGNTYYTTDNRLPIITSLSNPSKTYNTLVMSATVDDDKGLPITERGFCWSTSSNPTISGNKIAVGSGTSTFSDTIKGLSQNTNYYVRAYAINAAGTSYYGSTYYTTVVDVNQVLPVITGLSNTSKTYNTLVMSASVSSGLPVTEHGFCWGTSSSPTISNSKIAVGSGIGAFSGTITGLSSGTSYYIRAYATNTAGTSYYGSSSYTTDNFYSVTIVTLNRIAMTLVAGSTETLTATVQPSNASIKAVLWESSNTAVATVANGTVTAVAAGTATITVTTQDGNKTATCAVTVTALPPTMTLGGVTWAAYNVNAYQTFATHPDMYTSFYQWNRSTALAATGGEYISTASITDASWTVIPCPSGWRLPTQAELQALHDAGSTWANANSTKGNNVAGRFYGVNHATCTINNLNGCIFLPAVGYRYSNSLSSQGSGGYYWSSEQYGSSYGYYLNFDSSGSNPSSSNYSKTYGMNVRCVQ